MAKTKKGKFRVGDIVMVTNPEIVWDSEYICGTPIGVLTEIKHSVYCHCWYVVKTEKGILISVYPDEIATVENGTLKLLAR